jgi:DNA gyrase/topoisomerase IV subunit A
VSCSRTIAGAQAADLVAPIRVPPPVPPTPLQYELFHQFERQAKVIVQLADNLRAAQGERERWRKVYDKLQQEKASLQREIRERRDRQQRGRSEGEPS